MKPDTKQHGINISLSALASAIPVLLAVWFFIKPAVVLAVGEQLQQQVQQTVAMELQPINAALAIMLRNAVTSLSKQISAMEFRRDFPPSDDWTREDAAALTDLEAALESNVRALAALITVAPSHN